MVEQTIFEDFCTAVTDECICVGMDIGKVFELVLV
jgi:hypothetical protein